MISLFLTLAFVSHLIRQVSGEILVKLHPSSQLLSVATIPPRMSKWITARGTSNSRVSSLSVEKNSRPSLEVPSNIQSSRFINVFVVRDGKHVTGAGVSLRDSAVGTSVNTRALRANEEVEPSGSTFSPSTPTFFSTRISSSTSSSATCSWSSFFLLDLAFAFHTFLLESRYFPCNLLCFDLEGEEVTSMVCEEGRVKVLMSGRSMGVAGVSHACFPSQHQRSTDKPSHAQLTKSNRGDILHL